MSHIHTKPGQYDIVVSAFIIRTDGTEPAVLMHWHVRVEKWMHFGGHIELDENMWQAVLREVREESGYDADQLTLLQPRTRLLPSDIEAGASNDVIVHPQPTAIVSYRYSNTDRHYHTDIAFAFTTDSDPRHPVGDNESTNFKTFTASELRAAAADDFVPDGRIAALLILEKYMPEWERLPVSGYRH